MWALLLIGKGESENNLRLGKINTKSQNSKGSNKVVNKSLSIRGYVRPNDLYETSVLLTVGPLNNQILSPKKLVTLNLNVNSEFETTLLSSARPWFISWRSYNQKERNSWLSYYPSRVMFRTWQYSRYFTQYWIFINIQDAILKEFFENFPILTADSGRAENFTCKKWFLVVIFY